MSNQKVFTTEDKLVCRGGTIIIDDAASHDNLLGLSLSSRDGAVIDECTGFDRDGNAFDFKAQLNWVNVNDLLVVPNNYYITHIKLTSGAINLNLG